MGKYFFLDIPKNEFYTLVWHGKLVSLHSYWIGTLELTTLYNSFSKLKNKSK